LFYSIMIAVGFLVVVVVALNMLLPGFEKQRQVARFAESINLTAAEITRMQQNPMVRAVSDSMQRNNWMINLFGRKNKEIYEKLGMPQKYEVYIAQTLVYAILTSIMMIVVALLLEIPILYLLAPIGSGIMIWQQMGKIALMNKNRKNELTRDLTLLISKMLGALEVGTPLRSVFEQVSKRSGPLLSDLLNKLIADLNAMPMKDALERFANTVDIQEIYDFVSVVNIIQDKGFRESESDLQGIQNDIDRLNRLSLELRLEGEPKKFNKFNYLMIAHVAIFILFMIIKLWNAVNSI